MDEEHFSVRYDGPALAGHLMDVRHLAPALIALSETFQRAERLLMPDQPPLSLKVKATEAGSFDIDLLLTAAQSAQDWAREAWQRLDSPGVERGLNLAELVGYVLATIALIKDVGKRKLKGEEPGPEAGTVLLEFDGMTIEVPTSVALLVRSVEFRQQVSEVVEPLRTEGIDSFQVEHREQRVEVTAGDVGAFEPPQVPQEEDLDVSERKTLLQLLGVEFDNRKWRFTEGGAPLTAAVEDAAFIAKIDSQEETFGSQDLLRAVVRTRQYRDSSGKLKAEHTILKVLEHIEGGRQLPLDLSPGPNPVNGSGPEQGPE